MGIIDTTKRWANDDLHLDITYCDDQLVMNGKEVWTYLAIEGEALGIPTDEDLDEHQARVHSALEHFRNTDFHYYLATYPYDANAWMERMFANQERDAEKMGIEAAPALADQITLQAQALQQRGYKTFVRYLGVKLGTRRKMLDEVVSEDDSAVKTWLSKGKRFMEKHSGGVDPQPSKREIAMWTKKAIETRARFSRNEAMNARGVGQEEMWSLLWHITSLGVEAHSDAGSSTETWGSGEIRTLAPTLDTRDPTYLGFSRVNPSLGEEFRQYRDLQARHEEDPAGVPIPVRPEPVLDGYATVLSVNLAKTVESAWIFHATKSGIPVDVSVRFRVKAKETATKDAQRAAEKARQAVTHQEESGIHGGNVTTARAHQAATEHAKRLEAGEAETQLNFTARFIVHGSDRDRVLADTMALIQSYKENHRVDLHWFAGTQESLLRECIPGQRVNPSLHIEDADIQALTNGLPFSTETLGYRDGFYVGSFGQQPFLFDPARSAREGKAPAILFSGSLGGGKTSAILTYVDFFRLRNFTCILLDPKRDIRSTLALDGRGHARVWNLTRDGRPGVLDPFTMIPTEPDPSDPERDTPAKAYERWREETHALVMDVLQRTLGDNINAKADMPAVMTAVVTSEMNRMDGVAPSMQGLLQRFRNGEIGRTTEDMENVGASADQVSNMKIVSTQVHDFLDSQARTTRGRLIYGARSDSDALMIEDVRTTIIDMSGLDLPEPDAETVTPSNRMSLTLFSLVATYAQRVLENPKIRGPKCIVVDEYHQIRDQPAMQAMAQRSNRMGRSLNIIPMYADQSSATANNNSAFNNSVGARVAFRSDRGEAKAIAASLDRPNDESLIESIPSKDDAPGRALHTTPADSAVHGSRPGIGVVSFDRNYNPAYADAFETNDIPGFVRASERHYDLDSYGVHYDPLTQVTQGTRHQSIPDEETNFVSPEDVENAPTNPVAADTTDDETTTPQETRSPELVSSWAPTRTTASASDDADGDWLI